MTDKPSIVQFPHPGRERFPKPLEIGATLPWNTGDHGRKFLVSSGTWIDAQDRRHEGSVTFWGEWEAQSRAVEVCSSRVAGMPRALQEPWSEVADSGWRQNTDPLVFGETFAYSNCRQRRNRKLRNLAPCSVVLFGSKLGGGFVLDTVLVVASASAYRPVDGPPDGVDASRSPLVTEPLALNPKDAEVEFTWYQGATHAQPQDGLFSFVPALPHEAGNAGFPRPRIELDGFVTPKLAMAVRTTPVGVDQARAVWDAVVEQVLDAGLVLGTRFELPLHVTADEPEEVARVAGRC